jgi:hypothetical protein
VIWIKADLPQGLGRFYRSSPWRWHLGCSCGKLPYVSITDVSRSWIADSDSNLATYATLFGMPWLEPYMWRFQKWLYNKSVELSRS